MTRHSRSSPQVKPESSPDFSRNSLLEVTGQTLQPKARRRTAPINRGAPRVPQQLAPRVLSTRNATTDPGFCIRGASSLLCCMS